MKTEQLLERARPHYAVLGTWVLLATALWLVTNTHWTAPGSERTLLDDPHARDAIRPVVGDPVTLLAWLPAEVLFDDVLYWTLRWAFVGFAVLWALHLALPWSSWLAALAFTATVSVYQQRWSSVDHTLHVTNMALLAWALGYHAAAGVMRRARRQGRFWSTPVFPRWTRWLAVVHVALFYGLAGISKLRVSGLDWPNGLSLQLWIHVFGQRDTAMSQWLLGHRGAAAAVQWAALTVELSALAAPLSRLARPVVGLALVAMHVGIWRSFGWSFAGNVVVAVLVLLPVEELADRLGSGAASGGEAG